MPVVHRQHCLRVAAAGVLYSPPPNSAWLRSVKKGALPILEVRTAWPARFVNDYNPVALKVRFVRFLHGRYASGENFLYFAKSLR